MSSDTYLKFQCLEDELLVIYHLKNGFFVLDEDRETRIPYSKLENLPYPPKDIRVDDSFTFHDSRIGSILFIVSAVRNCQGGEYTLRGPYKN